MKRYLIFITIIVLFTNACNKKEKLSNFTYRFSMESPANFKAEFLLRPDSTYRVSRYNYFFDNFEGKKKPEYKEGKLSKNEFDTFKQLIANSRIETLKDAYGFDNPTKSRDIIYIVELSHSGKTKYVSVNGETKVQFPNDFPKLIEYTTEFINKK
jgi:hypothetical protein